MTATLYAHPLSGHSHRVQLFLSLIGLDHEVIEVDLAQGAHKAPDFLKLNPFGQVPVLIDDDVVLSDSNAILIYLAKKHGLTDWLPEDAEAAAHVQRWLSVAAGELAAGPAAARLITVFGAPYDPAQTIKKAHALLALIDTALRQADFIAGGRATIADVALYSYVARAPEGNVDLSGYSHINAWLSRIEALPGFVPFTRTPVGLDAAA